MLGVARAMSTYEFIVSIVGLLVVGSLGTVMAYRNAKSRRERSFLFRAVGLQAVLAFGGLTASYYFQWSQPRLVLVVVLAIFVPVMFWIDRRVRRIRVQHDDTNA
jgi:ABC-type Mn2+/Zn2+ transport system permease subunit